MAVRQNRGSVNGINRSFGLPGLGLGGRRARTVTLATARRPRMMNAEVCMVHAKPISDRSLLIMMGKTTPPKLDPLATMPMASPAF
jgi:hypothetical protein